MSNDKHIKQKAEQGLQEALAFEIAKNYCIDNGLSIDKLRKQRFNLIYSSAVFAQPSEAIPNGLLNDLDTQPKPTLIIKNERGGLTIEQTEYTREYLSL
jgi:hypothetical protein